MIERYCSKKINPIWSLESKFNFYLKIELAVLESLVNKKIIPKEDFLKIQKILKVNVNDILEIEKETKHDVIAFTKSLSKQLGDEKKWIHFGLTSNDVVDSAYALQIKQANDIIEASLKIFISELEKKAIEYKEIPCIGRTHGIHAEITSFGLKWLNWYDEMKRNYERFLKARKNIEVIKISGAVGNHNSLDKSVEQEVSKILNLNFAPISTQVISRDRMAEYIFSCAQISSTIEKIAIEIRSLQRTEIDEVNEYFDKNQKGSSAMPHKRNPIISENMCGISRVIRSYVPISLENNILWHERDISHSSAERIMLPDITNLLDYMLERYANTIKNLIIKPENMLLNINKTYGVIFSQRILNFLVEKKSFNREEAYDKIQTIAFKSFNDKIDFRKILEKDNVLSKKLSTSELDELFDVKFYLKNIDQIYKLFFKS